MGLKDTWISKNDYTDVIYAKDINDIADQVIANEKALEEGGGGGGDVISPTIEVQQISGGHRVYITDANGTKHFDVSDGHTPVKGTDYFTEADKTELVNDVLSTLPTWNGGSY